MTDRLLRALECPHIARARAIPPAAFLLHRDPYPFDFDAGRGRSGAAQCLSRNQRQPRASGPDGVARFARRKPSGCKFVISTDAHHPKHLANMQLRRAHGAARVAGGGDILNTLPLQGIRAALITLNETNFFHTNSSEHPNFHRDLGSRDRSGRFRNQARHRAARRLRGHDAGGRRRTASCWSANIVLPARSTCGSFPPAASIRARRRSRPPSANWSKKRAIARRNGQKMAEFYPSPGFLAEKMTIYLATRSD